MSNQKSSNPKDVLASDEQRVLLHLIPSPALIETARALMDGARKYGPYNWREEGVGATTYLSASLRHIRAYLDGQKNAADSGVHHLGHAIACLAILLDAEAVGNLVDDRPLSAPTASLMDEMKRTRDNFIPAADIYVDDADDEDGPGEMGKASFEGPGKTRTERVGGYHSTARGVEPEPLSWRDRCEEMEKDIYKRLFTSPIPPESEGPGGCC